ncbi:MAG: DUF5723 family protein [Alloprevotella sp.]
MKHKISACILAAALALPVAAQELRSTYFMQTSNYRHEMNPALLDSGYISMPLIMGNLNFGTTGNVGLANFVYKMEPGWQGYGVDGRNLTTFMHPSVDAADFLGDLKDNNRISVNLKYNLAAVAFKAFKGTNIVELNLRSNTNISLPKELFAFMKEAGKNETYDISNLGVRTENFLELGLGHSHKINDKITVGGKVKLLFGVAYADFSADNLHVQMQGDQWAISGKPKLSAAILKSNFTYENDNPNGKIDGIDDVSFGLPGFGLAFDLGATYKVLDDLTISAAITDLGFINWSGALQAGANRDSWTFNGFEEDVYAGGTNTGSNKIGDQFEQIGDDLEEMLPLYDQGKKSETRALAATLNIGAEYTLPVYRPLRFGFLYTSRIAGKYSYHQGMLSANIRPVKWFEFALNGAVSSSGCTAGMVIDLHAKHFNFFIGADRFLGKVSKQFIPLHNMNSSVSLGMSFPL